MSTVLACGPLCSLPIVKIAHLNSWLFSLWDRRVVLLFGPTLPYQVNPVWTFHRLSTVLHCLLCGEFSISLLPWTSMRNPRFGWLKLSRQFLSTPFGRHSSKLSRASTRFSVEARLGDPANKSLFRTVGPPSRCPMGKLWVISRAY